MRGVTYDSGALIALDRGETAAVARHRGLLERGLVPVVPAGVLAQVWREPARQVRLRLALRGCRLEPLDEIQARSIGELARRVGVSDVADLSVAEGVLRRSDLLVTGDVDDLVACGVPRSAVRRP